MSRPNRWFWRPYRVSLFPQWLTNFSLIALRLVFNKKVNVKKTKDLNSKLNFTLIFNRNFHYLRNICHTTLLRSSNLALIAIWYVWGGGGYPKICYSDYFKKNKNGTLISTVSFNVLTFKHLFVFTVLRLFYIRNELFYIVYKACIWV